MWGIAVATPLGITGDFDGDGDIDLADRLVFDEAFSGPGIPTVDPRADFDGDEDVDLSDLIAFEAAFTDGTSGDGDALARSNGCDTVDADNDADIDLADFLFLSWCFRGPGVSYSAGPGPRLPACFRADLDGDDDVDLADVVAFQAAFTGAR